MTACETAATAAARQPRVGSGVAFAVVLAVAACVVVGCSLLVKPDASQCATDGDCARFEGAASGTAPVLVCVNGGCVAREAGPSRVPTAVVDCTSTQDCLVNSPYSVCRIKKCKDLLSRDCGRVVGAYTRTDAILLGAILPTFGTHKSSGLAMWRSLALAVDDFQRGIPLPLLADGGDGGHDAGGADGGLGARRPLAVVVCNESEDPVRAARHLVDDVGVPLIIGPAFSAPMRTVADQVTLGAGVLLISPRSVVGPLSADPDHLVWRMAPPVLDEAAALSRVVDGVIEPRLAVRAPGVALTVAVVSKRDAGSVALAAALLATLRFNGVSAAENKLAGRFLAAAYDDADDPATPNASSTYGDAVSAVVDAAPALVIVVGDVEGALDIVPGIDAAWKSATGLPLYLMTSGGLVSELLTQIGSDDALRRRILLTSPGSRTAPADALLARYFDIYRGVGDKEAFGMPQTFDALYATAFALATPAASAPGAVPTGQTTSAGLRLLLGARASAKIAFRPSTIEPIFTAVASAAPIDVEGASGPLDFDVEAGVAEASVQVWCVQRGDVGPPRFAFAGLEYMPPAAALTGMLTAGCL